MSVQVNQYLIYGIQLPYSFIKEWEAAHKPHEYDSFYATFEDYLDDSAFKPEWPQKNGVTVLMDGMNGEWLFIGYCYGKSRDGHLLAEGEPLEIQECPVPVSVLAFLQKHVKETFGIPEGPWKNHLVAMYR